MVCHRQNLKGAWKLEVWTNRDFAAFEILIGAFSTEIKDRMWTQSAAVIIGLPSHGASKHPDGKNIALDGRGRQVIAASQTIDEDEHRGSLFWTIQKTGDKAEEHNMSIEAITWDASLDLKLPNCKKRKVDMDSKDLPSLPVMTNPKNIKMHTRLVVCQDLERLQKLSKGRGQVSASSVVLSISTSFRAPQ